MPTPDAAESEVTQELLDEISDIVSPIHWETWTAALYCDHADGWPDDDEQEAIRRGVDDIAVLEHWDAQGKPIVEQLAQLVARHRTASTRPQAGVRRKTIVDAINDAIGFGEHGLVVDVDKAANAIAAALSDSSTTDKDGEALTLLKLARPFVGYCRSSSDLDRADDARLLCQRIDALSASNDKGEG